VASDLTPALFGSPNDIANNVAIYTLTVGTSGTASFDSSGYLIGGFAPYFTLFTGSGASATFLDSNYGSSGGDFHLEESLTSGTYTVAISATSNMSFAENWGRGTLADGFIQLGDPSQLGNASYSFTATTPVSEPSTAMLAFLSISGICVRRMTRKAG
jgi:hypothetical protein